MILETEFVTAGALVTVIAVEAEEVGEVVRAAEVVLERYERGCKWWRGHTSASNYSETGNTGICFHAMYSDGVDHTGSCGSSKNSHIQIGAL